MKAQGLASQAPGTDIVPQAVGKISAALNALVADVFALYVKTKNFHWHVSGPHFRAYHLLLDEQGEQLIGVIDDIAERVRKIGGTTVRSIGHIARIASIADNDAESVTPEDMLSELLDDNKTLLINMMRAHDLCERAGDVAGASALEMWIDDAQKRAWFLQDTIKGAL
jgi:starvation-inducible DNA-binding protein